MHILEVFSKYLNKFIQEGEHHCGVGVFSRDCGQEDVGVSNVNKSDAFLLYSQEWSYPGVLQGDKAIMVSGKPFATER